MPLQSNYYMFGTVILAFCWLIFYFTIPCVSLSLSLSDWSFLLRWCSIDYCWFFHYLHPLSLFFPVYICYYCIFLFSNFSLVYAAFFLNTSSYWLEAPSPDNFRVFWCFLPDGVNIQNVIKVVTICYVTMIMNFDSLCIPLTSNVSRHQVNKHHVMWCMYCDKYHISDFPTDVYICFILCLQEKLGWDTKTTTGTLNHLF